MVSEEHITCIPKWNRLISQSTTWLSINSSWSDATCLNVNALCLHFLSFLKMFTASCVNVPQGRLIHEELWGSFVSEILNISWWYIHVYTSHLVLKNLNQFFWQFLDFYRPQVSYPRHMTKPTPNRPITITKSILSKRGNVLFLFGIWLIWCWSCRGVLQIKCLKPKDFSRLNSKESDSL